MSRPKKPATPLQLETLARGRRMQAAKALGLSLDEFEQRVQGQSRETPGGAPGKPLAKPRKPRVRAKDVPRGSYAGAAGEPGASKGEDRSQAASERRSSGASKRRGFLDGLLG